MSELDYEQLEEEIIAHAIEENITSNREEAVEWLEGEIRKYDEHLWLMSREARLRNIAQTKCGMQIGRDIEEIANEPETRTIKSLEDSIPEYQLIVEAEIKKIRVRNISNGKKLADITISDGTATSKITLWEDEAEAVENGELVVGDIIRIHGAYTAEPYSDYDGHKVEIKKSKKGRIEKNPEGVEIEGAEPTPIADLAEGMSGISLVAKVQSIGERKTTSGGKDYTSMKLSDRAGNGIWLKLWHQDLVDMVLGPRVREGQIIKATDLRVDSWQGNIGVNTTDISTIDFVDDEDPEEYPEVSGRASSGKADKKYLVDAEEGDTIQFVGKIVRIYNSKPYYDSCPSPNCRKGIKYKEDGTTYCPNGCEEALSQPPIPVAKCSGQMADGTAVIRFTAMGDAAEKIIGLDAEKIKEEFDALRESSTETEDWKKTSDAAKVFTDVFADRMIQGFVNVVANVRIEKDYRGSLEMMIYEIETTNYNKEAEMAKARIKQAVQEASR